MDGTEEILIVQSGNNSKSIFEYINKIAQKLIDNNKIIVKAYDNNMNKLITIEEIIKNNIENALNVEYKIDQELMNNKKIPYIQAKLFIKNEEKIIEKLKILLGNNKKRNPHPFLGDKNILKKENNIEKDAFNKECINNIDQFFK